MRHVRVVGGGLAGTEAALQLADRGHQVTLYEMRGVRPTEAHRTDSLAELVCSNTFKSERTDTSSGAFKQELDLLGSRLLPLARKARVPGGHALALDRELFGELVTEEVSQHPRIEVLREEVTALDEGDPAIIATGPLTSPDLQQWLQGITGNDALYFYDAIAPSLLLDSVDQEVVFRQSRYDKGGADYLNCPMDKAEYEAFIDALLEADRTELREFEKTAWFSGCMPIEAIAERGRESLRFGPMRPVGLTDPRTGRRPWAAVQLRQETRDGSLFGLVGFQTRLRYGDQTRVFRMIPGLEQAEFVRLGSLHRNTYVDAPRTLNADLSLRARDDLWLAGQITGCEGYVESLATGLVAALAVDARLAGRAFAPPAGDSMLGSLLAYLRDTTTGRPSPMNVNFGLLPPLDPPVRDKRLRKEAHAARALESIRAWSREMLQEQAG
ncbi:methylenetetrahydrofolate--tRNA-(uracil(54)-C(5))-methyltransferase (FADH(2)-oxidizing) TrmFO [bacterium]|nr:MAG: methylenetetrahydrofolate--tRNA-(uracil(54)-C(5))-methyltransferase (FADH(2)-oxidizing) TrmFO [bacterium]